MRLNVQCPQRLKQADSDARARSAGQRNNEPLWSHTLWNKCEWHHFILEGWPLGLVLCWGNRVRDGAGWGVVGFGKEHGWLND